MISIYCSEKAKALISNAESKETSSGSREDSYITATLLILDTMELDLPESVMKNYKTHIRRVFPLYGMMKKISHRIADFPIRICGARELYPESNADEAQYLLDVAQGMVSLFSRRLSTYEAPFILAAANLFLSRLEKKSDFSKVQDFCEERILLEKIAHYFKLGKRIQCLKPLEQSKLAKAA